METIGRTKGLAGQERFTRALLAARAQVHNVSVSNNRSDPPAWLKLTVLPFLAFDLTRATPLLSRLDSQLLRAKLREIPAKTLHCACLAGGNETSGYRIPRPQQKQSKGKAKGQGVGQPSLRFSRVQEEKECRMKLPSCTLFFSFSQSTPSTRAKAHLPQSNNGSQKD